MGAGGAPAQSGGGRATQRKLATGVRGRGCWQETAHPPGGSTGDPPPCVEGTREGGMLLPPRGAQAAARLSWAWTRPLRQGDRGVGTARADPPRRPGKVFEGYTIGPFSYPRQPTKNRGA